MQLHWNQIKINVDVNIKNHFNNIYVKKIVYGIITWACECDKYLSNYTKDVTDNLIFHVEIKH